MGIGVRGHPGWEGVKLIQKRLIIAECDYFDEMNELITIYINIIFGSSKEITG
jgi:hypothetical protein